jgi:hypothetical protein
MADRASAIGRRASQRHCSRSQPEAMFSKSEVILSNKGAVRPSIVLATRTFCWDIGELDPASACSILRRPGGDKRTDTTTYSTMSCLAPRLCQLKVALHCQRADARKCNKQNIRLGLHGRLLGIMSPTAQIPRTPKSG